MKLIFVTEIDHNTRVQIRRALEAGGYVVASATNGKDALTILAKLPRPEVILVTEDMPMMSGTEFVNALSLVKKYATIPIIQIISPNEIKIPNVRSFVEKGKLAENLLTEIKKILRLKT